jgi:hypothetical protein
MSITDMLDGDSQQETTGSSPILVKTEEAHNGIARAMFNPFADFRLIAIAFSSGLLLHQYPSACVYVT